MNDDVQVLEALRSGVARLDDASGISVAGAVGAGRRRRRRRTAGRAGVAVTAVGAVVAGVLALGLGDDLPLLSSAPPAGPATLTPARGTNLDDAAAMRPVVEQVLVDAGRTLPPAGFSVGYAGQGEDPFGLGGGVVARGATSDNDLQVTAVHLDRGVEPGSLGCDVVAPRRPDAAGCSIEDRPDGTRLLELAYDSGWHERVLLHPDGWVLVSGDDLAVLRQVATDPRLRW